MLGHYGRLPFQPFLRFWLMVPTNCGCDAKKLVFQPFLRFWIQIEELEKAVRQKLFQPFLRFWHVGQHLVEPQAPPVYVSTLLEILV